jgi:hypothetical protein
MMPSHEITGTVHTVAADDVREHRRAYAALVWELLPHTLKVQMSRQDRVAFLTRAMQWARGEAIEVFGIEHGQQGDWAACDRHFALWERFKKVYP